MTSPATQEPCQKCKDQGVVVDAAGRIIPCDCIWGTSPAPPSQRAELLTQELESAMDALRDASDPHGTSHAVLLPREASALLQHIAALQSQLDTAQKDNLARHRQCGELRTKVAALTQRVEAAEAAISNMGAALTDCGNCEAVLEQAAKDAIDELASAHGEYAELAAGNARRILDAALSQEPRNG